MRYWPRLSCVLHHPYLVDLFATCLAARRLMWLCKRRRTRLRASRTPSGRPARAFSFTQYLGSFRLAVLAAETGCQKWSVVWFARGHPRRTQFWMVSPLLRPTFHPTATLEPSSTGSHGRSCDKRLGLDVRSGSVASTQVTQEKQPLG